MIEAKRDVGLGVLALFASLGTLLCCALPILLVALGLGSVVAALTVQLPFLVTLSEYKAAMFAASAVMLGVAARVAWRTPKCPADPVLADQCRRANRAGRRLTAVGISVWVLGLSMAYLLLPLRRAIGV